jgi:mannopine transport system ATP-binding protein
MTQVQSGPLDSHVHDAGSDTVMGLDSVTKEFGDYLAVNDVTLQVRRGEFLTLLGPSGSGKTTILKMIAGFEVPTSGTITLDDRDISKLSPSARGIGVVFQHYALFPHMSVLDNVAYPLKVRGERKSARIAKAREMLDLVNLADFADRRPKQLSGGQQQRVAIARALAFDPTVLLMDEPLGALDRALRVRMQAELKRLHRELKATIIYVTHDQEEALALSDRIGVLDGGRLIEIAAPDDLFERPSTAFVASFFGDANLLTVETLGKEAVLPDSLAGHSSSKDSLSVQPRFVCTQRSAPTDVVVPVTVEEVVYLGHEHRVIARSSAGDEIRGIVPAGDNIPKPGEALSLFIDVRGLRRVDPA